MKYRYKADFSLALVNRTGAFYISRAVIDGIPDLISSTRYWRISQSHQPEGLVRKILSKLMFAELNIMGVAPYQSRATSAVNREPVVFFDPLYVSRNDINDRDVVLCHDIGPITHPHLFEKKNTESYALAYEKIKQAKPGMVFDSKASEQAFSHLYGSDFRFMRTISLYSRSDATTGRQDPAWAEPRAYILSVGALEERKNYLRSIEAYSLSGLREKGVDYIICGPNGHGHDVIRTEAAAVPGVNILGRVSDAQLRWLYANASAFILPSLLEGFGVPAIEAAYAGVVSVLSRDTAQEEAVGGHGFFVDPYNVKDICRAMMALMDLPPTERDRVSEAAASFARSRTEKDFVSDWRELLVSTYPNEREEILSDLHLS